VSDRVSDDETRHSGSRWEPTPAAGPGGDPKGPPTDATDPSVGRIDDEPTARHIPFPGHPDPALHPLPPLPIAEAPRPRRALRRSGLLAAATAGLLAIGGAGGYAIGQASGGDAPAAGAAGRGGGTSGGTGGYGHHRGAFGSNGGLRGGNVDGSTQGGPVGDGSAGDGSAGDGSAGDGSAGDDGPGAQAPQGGTGATGAST
jgi:hypothetical protein